MAGLLDLFGKSKDERDMNYTLGLLSAAAGALQGNTTPQALGGALQGGLGFTNQLQQQRALAQKMAEQKRVNDARIQYMQRPQLMNTQRGVYQHGAGIIPGTEPIQSPAKMTEGDKRRAALSSVLGQLPDSALPWPRQYMQAGINAGTIDMKVDQANGRVILTDLARGTAHEVPLGRLGALAFDPAGGKKTEKEPAKKTGAYPYSTGNVLRGITDEYLGALFPYPEIREARQNAKLLREDMISAFSRSGRPSNFAQRRVEELMPSMNNPLGGAESAAKQWETTKEKLQQEVAAAQRIVNTTSRTSKARGEAAARVDAGRRAIGMIDDMIARFNATKTKKDTGGWGIRRR